MDSEELERQSRLLYEFVEDAERLVVSKVLKAGVNPTGLASVFFDRAMKLLDHNIQWRLKNNDTKGALDYLNVFMMDMNHKTKTIEDNIKRMKNSLTGSETSIGQVNGITFRPDDVPGKKDEKNT